MLEAPIRKRRRLLPCLTIALGVAAFTSCATEQPQPALVDDPDAQRGSSIPWNKPQSWEGRANFPGGLGGSGGGLGSPGPGD